MPVLERPEYGRLRSPKTRCLSTLNIEAPANPLNTQRQNPFNQTSSSSFSKLCPFDQHAGRITLKKEIDNAHNQLYKVTYKQIDGHIPAPIWVEPPQKEPRIIKSSLDVLEQDAFTNKCLVNLSTHQNLQKGNINFKKQTSRLDKSTCVNPIMEAAGPHKHQKKIPLISKQKVNHRDFLPNWCKN